MVIERRLKMTLLEAGVTQREAAAAIGISENLMSDWLRGRKPIPYERKKQLSAFLKKPLGSLFDTC